MYNWVLMPIFWGILMMGIGLIVDSIGQVRDFAQGGYLDDELRDRVFNAIWKFTLGFLIVAVFVFLFFRLRGK